MEQFLVYFYNPFICYTDEDETNDIAFWYHVFFDFMRNNKPDC